MTTTFDSPFLSTKGAIGFTTTGKINLATSAGYRPASAVKFSKSAPSCGGYGQPPGTYKKRSFNGFEVLGLSLNGCSSQTVEPFRSFDCTGVHAAEGPAGPCLSG